MIACVHKWEPAAILGAPGATCERCGFFTQLSSRQFCALFGYKALKEAKRTAARQVSRALGAPMRDYTIAVDQGLARPLTDDELWGGKL